MNITGLISGIVLIIIGIVLIVLGVVNIGEGQGILWVSFWGVVLLCIGIYMLFNFKKEDVIEQVRYKKKTNKKDGK